MRDDLMTYYTKSVAKPDSQTQEMEKQLVDRVARNVATIHSRFADCEPGRAEDETNSSPIDQNVRELIAKARSPEELCMMRSSYQGWL